MKRLPAILPVLLVTALGGAYIAGATSCSGTAGQRAASASDAFLDCDTSGVPDTIFKDLVTLAKQALGRLISGMGTVDEASVAADLKPIASDAGRCAASVAVAQIEEVAASAAASGSGAGSASTAPVMAAATTPDAPQIAATFRRVRAQLGWPRMRTRGREY